MSKPTLATCTALVALCLLTGSQASAATTVVYQNTDLASLQDVFSDTAGLLALGDEILLGAGGRTLSRVQTSVTTFDNPVLTDLRLAIYEVGPGDTVGPMLGSSVLTGVFFNAGTSTVVEFNSWSLTLPEQIIVMLSLENASSLVLGLDVTGNAAIGFSDAGFSWWLDGSGFFKQQFPDTPNNYFFVIDTLDDVASLPEPATGGAIAWGLGLLALLNLARKTRPS